MYCPKCATPNSGDVKFCRVCGTELEAVARMLTAKTPKAVKARKEKDQPKTAQDWLEKRIEGSTGITRGSILLTVSALIGLAMALFLPASFDVPWMLLWTVFFGWMAVWGGIELAFGISGALEAKNHLRLMELYPAPPNREVSGQQSLPPDEMERTTNEFVPVRPPRQLSVTEGTTRQLEDHIEK